MKASQKFLLPGEYIISKEPYMVTTLLGSCVAVCLYNHNAGFGGINHYMLPEAGKNILSGKYGDYANEYLVQFMIRNAGGLAGVEAMLFGGASVVKSITHGPNIGNLNVQMARTILQKYKIPIVSQITGGFKGMKIKYHTGNNRINWRYIDETQLKDLPEFR